MNKRTIEAVYPLSPMQQGMLFHSLYTPDAGIYVEQLTATIRGNLDSAAFEQAWQDVVERHPILRTTFTWKNLDKLLQVVHRRVELPITRHDWRDLSVADQDVWLDDLLEAERRRGFNLAEPPLMRLILLQIAPDTTRLVWTYHHLLLDGWSLPLLLHEVLTAYEALRLGQTPVWEPRRPYRDYIAWLDQQDTAQAEAFWRANLAGFTTPTPLGVDRSAAGTVREPARPDYRELHLPAETTAALRELVRQQHLTLNTLVQGAWAVLLSRYSGEQDLIFGTTVAGRPTDLPGAEAMIGLFINTLPLRVQLAPETPLADWLQEVQARQFALRQYEYSPLAQIQDWSEVPQGQALFESIVVFENYPIASAAQEHPGSLRIQDIDSREQTNYPLTVVVKPGQELAIKIIYDTRRFEEATIARMLGHLQTLLAGMVANPHQPLATLPLLTAAERQQLLVDWNATATDYPRDRCIHQLFTEQADRTPDAPAVIFQDQTLTYQELNRRANQLAHYLRRQGVGPETLVALCAERSLEMIVGVLGILKAGGAYVPLDPTYPPERLAFMLEDTQAPVVITHGTTDDGSPPAQLPPARGWTTGPRAGGDGPRTTVALDADWPAIAREPDTPPDVSVTPDHLAYVTYTSGSTGQPKGVSVVHRGVVRLVRETDYAHFGPDEVVLQFAPITFDASTFEIWGPLLNGGRLVVMPPQVPSLAILGQALRDYQVTTLWLTAGLFHLMVDERPDDLAGLRQLLAGGDVLSVPHVRKALQALPATRLINGYGPTENTTFTCCYTINAVGPDDRSIPIGRPIANTQVYILDHNRQPVPIGVPGELYIGGDGLARGYLHRPELTDAAFVPNPFAPTEAETRGGEEAGRHGSLPHRHTATPPHRHTPERLYRTGDLARHLPNGDIEYLGRIDHQVKIRGFRIEPGEIEAVLGRHPAVQDVVVVAREDTPGDRRLVAYVVLTSGPRAGRDGPPTAGSAANQQAAGDAGALREFLKTRLPDYMLPSAFVVLDALPLNPNGKVDRQALPAPDSTRPELERPYTAPRTPVEETLADIWAQVLGVQQVGIYDNFFELGGDSILSIQVVSRANRAGLRLTPAQIFQFPTIADLVNVVGTGPAIQAEQGLVEGPLPLTPIQHWFFAQDLPEPHHWNQSLLLEIQQPMDPVLLRRAIDYLLRHHDALRLTFTRSAGRWHAHNAGTRDTVPVDWIDLSPLPTSDRLQALAEHTTNIQASLNLAEGPLLRAAYFHMGQGSTGRLLIVIHHLAVDGVSWRIVLEDLQTLYQQLRFKETVQLPPKTTSYQAWARQLEAHARTSAVQEELAYWLAVPGSQRPSIPVDNPTGENTVASAQTLSVALTAAETTALVREVPAAYHTEINDVLLAALAQAYARWTGVSSLLVDLEGHGRENILPDVDLTRTVGWFTTIFPVRLDVSADTGPREALTRVKEYLRGMPHRGINYGVLRYLSADPTVRESLRALPQAEVSFNYLGQLDQALLDRALFRLAPESRGQEHSLQGQRRYLITINSSIVAGQLQVAWTYSANLHHHATIEHVARDFIETLRALISHCLSPDAGGYTPSDVAAFGWDQAELEDIVAEISREVNS